MYRDERRGLEAQLQSLRDALAESVATRAQVEADARGARRSLARGRRWRWLPRGAAALGLVALVGSLATVLVRRQAHQDKLRGEIAAVERRVEEHEARLAGQERSARAFSIQLRTLRGSQTLPESGGLGIFVELRYLPLESEEDAWVIVGGAACALGNDALRARAEEALDGEARDALRDLCARGEGRHE